MANPPPVRPWFRLASIRSNSNPTPTPAPAQEPRPTLGLPAFRTASAPSSPQTQPTQPPQEPSFQPNRFSSSSSSSSLPTSPVHKATITTTSSPTRSPPKTIKQSDDDHRSPMQSPSSTTPPPSPLTLPPSQLRTEPKIPEQAEPKAVLVQKTIDRPKPWFNGATGNHGKHVTVKESESKEESGMRVITIAGENRGAYMELIQSPKKPEPKYLHKKGNSSINVDGVESESSSTGEEGNVNKGRTSSSSFPRAAYMNSNVQCVNNSLLYHTSCSHHDPGLRLSLSKKPSGEGFHVKEHA